MEIGKTLPFSMLDVLDRNALSYDRSHIRKEMRLACPFCGKNAFYVNTQSNTAHCFGCEWKGGILKLDADLNGYSTGDAYRAMEKELGFPGLSDEGKRKLADERRRVIEESIVYQKPMRRLEERNQTYTALSRHLVLSGDHYEDLKKRGLSDNAIRENGYRSYPQEMLEEISLRIQQEGFYVDGVPGFYRNEKDMWTLKKLKRGFMCPVRNHEGMIQGYQIRKDDRLLRSFYKRDSEGNIMKGADGKEITERENKFVWLSSKNDPDGCGAPGAVHYATDFRNGRAVIGKTVYLTEGPLKGDIAHFISGKPFICVPGVSLQTSLSVELERLKTDYGVEKIVVCYDMDYLVNPNVAEAVRRCYELIRENKLSPYRAIWNTKFKGIDDYLVAVERNQIN